MLARQVEWIAFVGKNIKEDRAFCEIAIFCLSVLILILMFASIKGLALAGLLLLVREYTQVPHELIGQ
jgi:hypothetical protein